VHGDAVGRTLFYGAGAGELPTASAVVGDLMELAREIRHGRAGRVAPLAFLPDHLEPLPLVPLGELVGRCYLVFQAADRPGVLGHIASELGDHGISIESVLQKKAATASGAQAPSASGAVPVLVFTHPAREDAVRRALATIDRLPEIAVPTRLVRIEEEL
jgi:homoserine dehydrogenase